MTTTDFSEEKKSFFTLKLIKLNANQQFFLVVKGGVNVMLTL